MDTGRFTLTVAAPHDVPAMVQLRAMLFVEMASHGSASRPAAAGHGGWEDAAASLITQQLTAPDHRYAVAKDTRGQVVGWGRATLVHGIPGPGFPTGRMGLLHSVVVAPSVRGAGLGTLLSQDLLAWLFSLDVEVVDLLASASSESLYRRLGFTDPVQTPLRLLVQPGASAMCAEPG